MTPALSLFDPFLRAPLFEEFASRLRERRRGLAVAGLTEGAKALALTLVRATTGRPFLLVVPDDAAVEAARRDLSALSVLITGDSSGVIVLPAMDADPYDGIPPHPEVCRERIVALSRLSRSEIGCLIVPARALLSRLPSPEELSSRLRVVEPGSTLPPDRFVLESMAAGYRRVETVAAPGDISRRGGIVDIFPPDAEEPVRIELFGDTVESLRSFDSDHQRSTGTLTRIAIGPAVENPATDEAIKRLKHYLEDGAARARSSDGPVREFRERLGTLQSEGYFPGVEALAAVMASRPVTLFEHTASLLLIVDNPEAVEDELIRATHDARSAHEQSGDRILPPPDELFADPAEVRRHLREAHLFLTEFEGIEAAGTERRMVVRTRPVPSYSGRLGDLARDLMEAKTRGERRVVLCRAPGGAERLGEILEGYGLNPAVHTAGLPGWISETPGGLVVLVAPLRAGFESSALGFGVFAERDIFGEERRQPERKVGSRAAFLSDFRDLKVGDLVVHVDHGIARYAGLGRPKGGSLNRDFMTLEFALGDRLFVPADRLDLVQKYSGVAGHRPGLDRLGGSGWEKVKTRVRRSVESMAKELLDLYARRRAAPGIAFSPDTAWQKELESAFPYELTPDQERVIREVKEDMEASGPMDRLLVGDVGFGKTEVAVRAAFKAVMDGYQVAILTPTTVLALQHEGTFRERFAQFPVRVEMVSRFRSSAEVSAILRGVEAGETDVLIGTHRLLSRDVRFKRLGLLVVDEEQRFGVAHKERLKKLSLGLDVLSMTATPIPRTLQMSLAGVRDLSILETPPSGRTAIQTYLVPFRRNILSQALRQELRRGGQAFVVHDRVETLPALARAVQEMVPEARVAVAHGRMDERALERVMMRFVHRDADILVTTTIVENGLDIPSANTIVVNRADRFGLAQLYQLRGRVGRSPQHAYAYLVIPGRQALSEAARRRLKALQDFSELGAGFRLAAADLEIRGAGEFLGDRQHGHIAALGFDLYCQMLESAVAELKGEAVAERRPATLHMGIDIKIPESYLPDVGDRLALYKRLSVTKDVTDVDRLQAETEDRYGHLPPSGRNLFDLGRLRVQAEACDVKSVDVTEGKLQIRLHERPEVDPRRIVEMIARARGSLTASGMLILPAPEKATERINAVRAVLEAILDASPGASRPGDERFA